MQSSNTLVVAPCYTNNKLVKLQSCGPLRLVVSLSLCLENKASTACPKRMYTEQVCSKHLYHDRT